MDGCIEIVHKESRRKIDQDCAFISVNKHALRLVEEMPSKLEVRSLFVSPYTCDPVPDKDKHCPDCGSVFASAIDGRNMSSALDIALAGGLELGDIKSERVALFAGAGFGKTMLLNRIALFMMDRIEGERDTSCLKFRDEMLDHSGGWLDLLRFSGLCPLVIRCRDLEGGEVTARSILKATFLPSFIEGKSNEELDEIINTIGTFRSRFALLIDGLDELPIEANVFLQALQRVFRIDKAHDIACILTCRDVYQDPSIDYVLRVIGPTKLKLKSLNDIRDSRRRNLFITQATQAWFMMQHPEDREKAKRKSATLSALIEREWSDRFSAFLRSPLDLTLLCSLYSDTESLPVNRQELYSRYIAAKLRWRKSGRLDSGSAEDTLLKLSFCAARMALNDGVPGSFRLTVPVEEFRKYLGASYSRLNSQIVSPSDRGLTREEATRLDFNEMAYLHGLLTVSSNGDVGFEHRLIQDFLVANAIVSSAGPKSLCALPYPDIIALASHGGSLDDDWINTVGFMALDARVRRDELDSFCLAIADATTPGSIPGQAATMFADILGDERITAEDNPETITVLLRKFLSRDINSSEFPLLKKMANEKRYEGLKLVLDRLYRNSCEQGYYYYSLAIGCMTLYEAVRGMPDDDVTRINALSRYLRDMLNSDFFIVMHALDVITWLKNATFVFDSEIAYVKRFFEGEISDERSKLMQEFTSAFANVFLNGSVTESTECIRVMNTLGAEESFKRPREAIVERVFKRCCLLYEQLGMMDYEADFVVRSRTRIFEYIASLTFSWPNFLGEEDANAAAVLLELDQRMMGARKVLANAEYAATNRPLIAAAVINCRNMGLLSDTETLSICKALFENGKRPYRPNESCMPLKDLFGIYRRIQLKTMGDGKYINDSIERLDTGDNVYLTANNKKTVWQYTVLRQVLDEQTGNEYIFYEWTYPYEGGKSSGDTAIAITKDSHYKDHYQFIPIDTRIFCSRYNPNQMAAFRAQGTVIMDAAFDKPLEFDNGRIVDLFLKAFGHANPTTSELSELKFKAVDTNGNLIECETLFMFESPETGRNYIVYTDNSVDEEGNTRVYASIYNPEDLKTIESEDLASLELIPIETDKEWEIIGTILEEMQNQVEETGVVPTSNTSPEADGRARRSGQRQAMEVYDSPVALFEAGKYVGAIRACLHFVDANPNSMSNKSNLAFLIRYCDIDLRDFPADEAFALKSLYTVRSLLEDGVNAGEPFSLLNMALYEYGKDNLRECVNLLSRIGSSDWQTLTRSFWHSVLWQKKKASEGALVCALAARYSDCRFEDQAEIERRAYEEYAPLLDAVEQKR